MSGLHATKIVVPVDFSELSFGAIEKAVEVAGEDGTVEVILVLGSLSVMEPGNLYGTLTDESRIESTTNSLRKKLAAIGYDKVSVHVVIGDAGHRITEFAEQIGADMIILPSHGYGFVKRILLGSVAERVVRLAHCPVLVQRS